MTSFGISGQDLHDVALVHFAPINPDPTTAVKLWAPADPQAALSALVNSKAVIRFAGATYQFTQSPDDPMKQFLLVTPAIGHQTIDGVTALGLLEGDAKPSGVEHGDSGGPAYVTLGNNLPGSIPAFPFSCAVQPALDGETILVGLSQGCAPSGDSPDAECLLNGARRDFFVPLFRPDVVQWIAQTTAADADDDKVCDDGDNCPNKYNPNQPNHNKEAEDAWGIPNPAVNFGDDCDGAPTPFPVLDERAFVGTGSFNSQICGGGASSKFELFLNGCENGRAINDEFTLLPVLADGSTLKKSTARRLFCDCRDENLLPIAEIAKCSNPNGAFRCILDPNQAQFPEGPAELASPTGPTAWHFITPVMDKLVAKLLPNAIDYPGAPVTHHWDYLHDYDQWVNVKGWMKPANADPAFPSGTDLGGAIWGWDDATTGADQHGLGSLLCAGCIDSIADGFNFGVAPDPKVVRGTATFIFPAENFALPDLTPVLCPPYCPEPGAGGSFAAEPFLTVDAALNATFWYPRHGADNATRRVSAALRAAIRNPAAIFIPSSEPATIRSDAAIGRVLSGQPLGNVSEPPSPRALFILPEGAGFSLHAEVGLPDGTLDLAKVESFGADTLAELSRFLGDPQKRSQIAIVYARTANALFIVHAADAAAPPLSPRTLVRMTPSPIEPSKPWLKRSASMSGKFHTTTRAVFSPRDWRIWVLDGSAAKKPSWRLRRIDPLTGAVETSLALPALDGVRSAWLTTWEDGRVLLVANRKGGPLNSQGNGNGNGNNGNGNNGNGNNGNGNNGNGNNGAAGDEQIAAALIASTPFRPEDPLTVGGVFLGKGQALMAPKVSSGVLSLFTRRLDKKGAVEVIGVTASGFNGSWPELNASLGGPNVPLD